VSSSVFVPTAVTRIQEGGSFMVGTIEGEFIVGQILKHGRHF
jgi:hypothetical protein